MAHLPPPPEHVKELARRLIGTMGNGDLLDAINELTTQEAKQLDLLALMCEGCEWWFAHRDITDTGSKYYCRECMKEYNK